MMYTMQGLKQESGKKFCSSNHCQLLTQLDASLGSDGRSQKDPVITLFIFSGVTLCMFIKTLVTALEETK